MTYNSFINQIKKCIQKIQDKPSIIRKEHIYALLNIDGVLTRVYLTIKTDKNGLPYFIQDEKVHKKYSTDDFMNTKINISEFSVANLCNKDKPKFFTNGRYENSYAESYAQIALFRTGLTDSKNRITIRDIVTLNEKGLHTLEYENNKPIPEKSIELIKLCLETNFGIELT